MTPPGRSATADYAPLWGFLGELDSLMGPSAPVERVVFGVKDRLAGLLKTRPAIPDRVRTAAGGAYARHLLYGDPQGRYEVVVMAWGPGQQTPVHDHSGIWC